MRLIVTALLIIAGLFFVFVGLGFFIYPSGTGSDFGIAANTEQGLSLIRADLTAFFAVAGACMIWGGWRRRADPLVVAGALFAIAFVGRLVGVLADGPYSGWYLPMAVEAAAVALCFAGWRMLPRRIRLSKGFRNR